MNPQTLLVVLLALSGCERARLEAKLEEFEKQGAMVRMSTCLCPGLRLERAEAVFEEKWPTPEACREENARAVEALRRFSQAGTPVGVVFRKDVGLEFFRASIFLEPGRTTYFHESIDCLSPRGCTDILEQEDPSSSIEFIDGTFRRYCPGGADLGDVPFTTALISTPALSGGERVSVSWALSLPYAAPLDSPRGGCDGQWHPSAFWQDGRCDAFYDCERASYDGGDCR